MEKKWEPVRCSTHLFPFHMFFFSFSFIATQYCSTILSQMCDDGTFASYNFIFSVHLSASVTFPPFLPLLCLLSSWRVCSLKEGWMNAIEHGNHIWFGWLVTETNENEATGMLGGSCYIAAKIFRLDLCMLLSVLSLLSVQNWMASLVKSIHLFLEAGYILDRSVVQVW